MSYFTKEYLIFLSELEKNNNREWFNANKARFKEEVEGPFKAFITDLLDHLSVIDTRIAITQKEAIYRIYRDVRFRKDKTPYKTKMSASVGPGGRKGNEIGGIYIEAGATHFRIFTGFYMPTTKQVKQVREEIAYNMDHFKAILEEPNFKKLFGAVQGAEHKRVPKEYADLIEAQPLLMKKSYYAFNEMPANTVLKKDLVEICKKHYIAAQPFGQFFNEAIEEV